MADLTRDTRHERADLQHHNDLVARNYADRVPAEVREFALALDWAGLRDPVRHDLDAGSSFTRAARRQSLALVTTGDTAATTEGDSL